MLFLADWGNILILKNERGQKIGVDPYKLKPTFVVHSNPHTLWKFNEITIASK
jgi:hypothetical protein